MPFGQLVIGPPGSGKTTYCNGMQQYLRLLGRKAAVVNLDPANDALPYECAVDVGELVSLEAVMERMSLGPNGGAQESALPLRRALARPVNGRGRCVLPTGGAWPLAQTRHRARSAASSCTLQSCPCRAGLIYCADYLAQNLDWLEQRLAPLEAGPPRARSCGRLGRLATAAERAASAAALRRPGPCGAQRAATSCSTAPARWSCSRCTPA